MRIGVDARHAGLGLGIGTFVTELVRHLAALGQDEVTWFGDPEKAPPGVASVVHTSRLPYPVLDTGIGRALARRAHVEVFHLTGNTGWARPGIPPAVLTLHDLQFMTSAARGRSLRQVVGHRYARRNILAAVVAASIVAVPSRVVAAQVRERFPAAPEPAVVPNGVDVPETLPPKTQPPYVVAFAGRDPRKRTDDVLAALRTLDGVRLRLLSGGGLPDGFRERAAPELASGRLELVGYIPRPALVELLARASALLYPSAEEGFGLPVLDALAVGTPAIAGIAPSTSEVGGDAILSIDPGDPVGSMAAAVRSILAEPALAASLAARGRDRARAFSWRATATRYAELYREAVEV